MRGARRRVRSAPGRMGPPRRTGEQCRHNRPGTVLDQRDDHWAQTIAVNLTGAFLVTRLAAAMMSEQRSGTIVNVGSIGGAGFGGSPACAASKAGLVGLTKQAARELGPAG